MNGNLLVPEMAAWVNSLADWKVFATHTFRWEAGLWSARRTYERFMRQTLPTVSYFYAIERNPARDGHHIHAIWDCDRAPRKATHRSWLMRFGRNRIEPVRGLGSVENYCAKYVCKDDAWWEFHLSRGAYAKLQGEKSSPLSLGGFSGSSVGETIKHQAREQSA